MSKISFQLGNSKNAPNESIRLDLTHLLAVGVAGTGKSNLFRSIIFDLFSNFMPDELQVVIADLKILDYSCFSTFPHLLIPIISNGEHLERTLTYFCEKTIPNRLHSFYGAQVRSLDAYNQKSEEKEPHIAIFIDSFELVVANKTILNNLREIIIRGRTVGVFVFINSSVTPPPSFIDNFPTRIAFSLSSTSDSRKVIGAGNAASLHDIGDCLYTSIATPSPVLVTTSLLDEEPIQTQNDELLEEYNSALNAFGLYLEQFASAYIQDFDAEQDTENFDPLLPEIVEMFMAQGQASLSMIQRRMRIGYAKAARLMDALEDMGIISASEGSAPRKVLISLAEFEQVFGHRPNSPDCVPNIDLMKVPQTNQATDSITETVLEELDSITELTLKENEPFLVPQSIKINPEPRFQTADLFHRDFGENELHLEPLPQIKPVSMLDSTFLGQPQAEPLEEECEPAAFVQQEDLIEVPPATTSNDTSARLPRLAAWCKQQKIECPKIEKNIIKQGTTPLINKNHPLFDQKTDNMLNQKPSPMPKWTFYVVLILFRMLSVSFFLLSAVWLIVLISEFRPITLIVELFLIVAGILFWHLPKLINRH